MSHIPENFARRIFEVAIDERRCSELLECLFDGGSVTIDALTGKLVMISQVQLDKLQGG